MLRNIFFVVVEIAGYWWLFLFSSGAGGMREQKAQLTSKSTMLPFTHARESRFTTAMSGSWSVERGGEGLGRENNGEERGPIIPNSLLRWEAAVARFQGGVIYYNSYISVKVFLCDMVLETPTCVHTYAHLYHPMTVSQASMLSALTIRPIFRIVLEPMVHRLYPW